MMTADHLWLAIPLGMGATLLIDIWAVVRKHLLHAPLPDYGLVGRWLVHVARGHFFHTRIAASPAVRAEKWIGWTAHYLYVAGCVLQLRI